MTPLVELMKKHVPNAAKKKKIYSADPPYSVTMWFGERLQEYSFDDVEADICNLPFNFKRIYATDCRSLWICQSISVVLMLSEKRMAIALQPDDMLWYQEVAHALSILTKRQHILESAEGRPPEGFAKMDSKILLRVPYPCDRSRDN